MEYVDEKTKAICKSITEKNALLKGKKSPWESYWKELLRFYQPNKDDVWGNESDAQRKGEELFDSTGRMSSEKLASFLHSALSNPSIQWFDFSTGNEGLDVDQEVAEWLQTAAKTTNNILNNSNFHVEIHEVYLDLTSICTGHLQIEEDEDDVVRFEATPIYNCAISEGNKGLVDTFYYEKNYTVQSLIDTYGFDNVGKKIQDIQYKEPLREICVIQAIEPSRYMPPEVRHPTMEFTSVHIIKDDHIILKKGGFEETPVAVPRFMKISGEAYGRGPSMYALPNVKTANSMMATWLRGAQLAINPPLQMPDEGVLLPVRFIPNGVNYYRAGSQDRIEPIVTGANPGIGNQIIEVLQSRVKEAFYIDQLHLVENDRMTATEVSTRKDEFLRTFSPILTRIPYELHTIAIMRTFHIASRKGLIPPPPPAIAKAKLEIKFVSQLARAQDTIEGETLVRALTMASNLTQLKPEVADLIDGDKHLVRIYKNYGASLDLLTKPNDVKKIRESRQKQMEEARQAELAKVGTEAGKNQAQAESMMR